jgi:hypothetical protein
MYVDHVYRQTKAVVKDLSIKELFQFNNLRYDL